MMDNERSFKKSHRVWFGVLLLALQLFPAALSALTVEQITNDLARRSAQILAMRADFTMKTTGTGEQPVQGGKYIYSADGGTSLAYETPVKMKMEMRPNGEVYVNGEKKRNVQAPVQNGDLYFLDYLSRYRLKVDGEDSNYVYLSGCDKASRLANRKLTSFRYDRALALIDRVEYRGSGKDYPFEISVSYTNVSGVPVTESLVTRLSAFSVTVTTVFRFDHISLDVK